MKMPENYVSIKSKMNSRVAFAIEHMNSSLEDLCLSEFTKPKDKLKATQDYLALFLRLENEIQREKESKENMKLRKLNTRIKEVEVARLENPTDSLVDQAAYQSKFSPTMTPS